MSLYLQKICKGKYTHHSENVLNILTFAVSCHKVKLDNSPVCTLYISSTLKKSHVKQLLYLDMTEYF